MIQKAGLRILDSFAHQNLRTFVDLCKEAGYPTDLGGYYLRQLVRGDYLSKGERGEYVLTVKGRKYLVDKTKPSSSMRPRVLVMAIAKYQGNLVVLERQKQPFLHRKEWPASAIRNGETSEEAVSRLLNERLSPSKHVKFVGVFRRTDFYQDELFDDKIFLIHEVELDTKPAEEVSTGINLLINEEDLSNQPLLSKSLLDILRATQTNTPFIEKTYNLSFDDFEPN